MSTSDLTVTLVGWVGTEPRHYTGTGVTPFTSFRMANTRRYFDRARSAWTDGRTEWFTVKVWRQSALNVAASLRKGDPVLVHGRLATEQWDGPEGPRTSLVLEALAIGPDLTYGRATFARTVHVTAADASVDASAASEPAGSDGDPARDGYDPWAREDPENEVTAVDGGEPGPEPGRDLGPEPGKEAPVGTVAATG